MLQNNYEILNFDRATCSHIQRPNSEQQESTETNHIEVQNSPATYDRQTFRYHGPILLNYMDTTTKYEE